MKNIHALLLALLLAAGAVTVTLVPLLIHQPFKAQTQGGISFSYQLLKWGPWWTLAVFLMTFSIFITLVRRRALWRVRLPVFLALLVTAATVYLTRVSLLELMFAPVRETGFIEVAEAEHVIPEEMVLGIHIGGEAKAYPVRMMAYHHIMNDRVGGVDVVVTY